MDERMRGIQREAAGGDIKEGARLLRELIRSGELSEGHVRLAAYLGERRSQIIFKEDIKDFSENSRDNWEAWLAWIAENNEMEFSEKKEVLIRMSLVSLHDFLSQFEEREYNRPGPRQAIEIAEKWVLSTHDDRDSVAIEALEPWNAALEASMNFEDAQHYVVEEDLIFYDFAIDAGLLARFVHDSIPEEEMYHTAARTLFNASMASDVNSIFTKIKKELIPWALGEGDPIKERVVARKAEEEA